MRACEECGADIHGRRKVYCDECKRARHAAAEKDRRDAARAGMAGTEQSEPADVSGVVSDGRAIGGEKWQAATPYRPRPAAPEPPVVDYTTADTGPRGGQPRTPDLTGIPASVRQDRVQFEKAMVRREFSGQEDDSDMTSWDALMQRNSRPDDGRTVLFDKPMPGSPQRQARPDEGRSLSEMLSTGREPNVDYLGRSTRRPRSWR